MTAEKPITQRLLTAHSALLVDILEICCSGWQHSACFTVPYFTVEMETEKKISQSIHLEEYWKSGYETSYETLEAQDKSSKPNLSLALQNVFAE